jgi:hypothetical protein
MRTALTALGGDSLAPLVARLDALIALLTPAAAATRSPWMTPAEVCHYFRWLRTDGAPSLDVFYQARRRYGLPASHVGGSLRCHRHYLEEWARTGGAAGAIAQRRAG